MFSQESLSKILECIGKAKVLVIGDLMLDNYIVGDVERISPEAPIPVMKIEKKNFVPGGAGNVVRNLDSLGVKTQFISLVGQDEPGRKLIKILSSMKNISSNILIDRRRKTSIKTRYIVN
ncbi:MAG TPA: bifunctional heptose 7-phosphate kinase/heptose 1-phosphate adenyltransferase, partial [Candidatus Dadabacteria bacterium]|nr:bifunctional heptose 7-phosphate kinase/heptose 1-phosphate adenyltransferase [Candidatus Dadabacteria bacterium]